MNPNASSCLHFTKRISTLKLILRDGIRHSYAFEEFPIDVIQNFINETSQAVSLVKPLYSNSDCGMAIPMVSFCDIPITRASKHSKVYGKYVIGLDKSFLLKYFKHLFNPVIYVNCEELKEAVTFFSSERIRTMDRALEFLAKNPECLDSKIFSSEQSARSIIESMPETFQKEQEQRINETFYSNILLALYKPVRGKDTYGNDRMFYDEREWRSFIPNLEDQHGWLKACTREQFLEQRGTLNKQIETFHHAYIKIPLNCLDAITHIIVKNEYQRENLINYILNLRKLFGYHVDRYETKKLKLISKIMSFEQIEKDY